MNNPITIHTPAESNVFLSSERIIAPQTKIPKIGTNGTSGVLNGRGASGFFTRRTQMPRQTNTNANNVPKLVKSPATLPGTIPANNPTKTSNSKFDLNGVRNVGCNSENTFGTRPSFDIE